MAYILPFFMISLFELPLLNSFRKKEQLLLFISLALMIISVSFYLTYPFRGTFFFFAIATLAFLYFFVLKHFYALKSLIMLTMSTGTIVLSTQPLGNLQIAYGFISSIALSMGAIFLSLKLLPNQYLAIWNKALQNFIKYFEEDIDNTLHHNYKLIKEEIIHFEMVRNYQRLVGKKYLLTTYRVAVYIRNIQLSLDNLYYEKKSEAFWEEIKANLKLLRMNMPSYTPCNQPNPPFIPETPLQQYVLNCLNKTFFHWNKLCKLHCS